MVKKKSSPKKKSAAKKAASLGRIQNRRARFDYELGDSLVVGMSLTGRETKALRLKHGHLRGAYVNVLSDELWLVGATVGNAPGIILTTDEQTRSRKLLAKRREISQLVAARQQGRTIVPLEILTNGRYVKLRISVGKGKRQYDKRQQLKERDQQRDAQRLS
ncbi:MAG: SsrA-binding protein SmpB [Candidatus Saccharimonadales bacterium]